MNFNLFPYYDDYDRSKSFHRILFRPGYAVQARELTQLQTILQDQIKRFGDNMYKDGTVIFGMAVSLNLKQPYVKVLDVDGASDVIDADLSDYVGDYLIGETSGVRALVKYVSEGIITSPPNLKTFYIDYVSSGTSGTNKAFTPGETLHIESDVSKTFVVPSDVATYFSTGFGSFITIDDGIVYANGLFVLHKNQTLPLEKYATQPSFKVGYRLKESTVSSDNDASLEDPAQGAYNFAAPGADRWVVETQLAKIALSDAPDPSFYLLYEIENGQVRRSYNKTEYAELRKELARRTYDESGNYTVRAFPILVREHLKTASNNGLVAAVSTPNEAQGGNANLLALGVEAGKAYVSGYEYETFMTEYVLVNKGISTQTYDQQIISTAYGNYLTIKEVCGNWDIELGSTIKLIGTAAIGAVTAGTFSGTADPSAAAIGTARVKSIKFLSGTPGAAGALYNIYLYDVRLTSGTVASIKSLYGATGLAFADVNDTAVGFQETSFNEFLYRIPAKAVKTIAPGTLENNYIYRKKITGVIANGGSTCTLNLPADEFWAFSSITPTKLIENFYVTIGTAVGSSHTYVNGTIVQLGTIPNPDRVVTYVTNQQLTLNMGETFASGATLTVCVDVEKINVRPILKTVLKHRYVTIDTNTHTNTTIGPWDLGVADVFAIEGVYAGTYSGMTPGTFSESNADLTDQFVLDNGQRDNAYFGGRLLKSPTASASFTDRTLLVKLSYFTFDYSSISTRRYCSVDSYPIDDTGLTPVTSINTYEIPVYVSPVSGRTYDLRDTLDFRPRVADIARCGANTILGSMNVDTIHAVNPTNSSTYDLGGGVGGYMVPLSDTNFITDVEFYLGRKDRLVIDDEGTFRSIPGIASLTPSEPTEQDNAMSLAIVNIPPYPSLAPAVAKSVFRPDYAVTVRTIDNRRYTMRDIGTIEQRINRMEYYTTLSLLEKAASDILIPADSGLDRFKNGILVDAFTGHNVGNVYDDAYHCAIDTKNRELRPYFNLESTDLLLSPYSSGYVRKAADAILSVTLTAKYTIGETVTMSGASGVVRHCFATSPSTVRVHVEQVSGTFTNGTLTGGTSGLVGSLTAVATTAEGHLLSLPYTHSILAQNKFASKSRNLVSQLQSVYKGELTLDPPQDTWVDINTKPDVQVNFDGNQDAWENLDAAWGAYWASWRINWQGVALPTLAPPQNSSTQGDSLYQSASQVLTTSTDQRQVRQGILGSSPDNQVQRTGTVETDTSVVPYMRSITITFVGDRLKPNTVVYPFFDGEDVSACCRPISTTALTLPSTQVHPVLSATFASTTVYGAALMTDSTGRVAGQFTIPAGRFRTGSKPFRLSDDSKNRANFVTTAATENFVSNGQTQSVDGSVVSTRAPRIAATTLSDSRSVQDSTSTDSIVAQRSVGVVQNSTVINSFTTINNTTSLSDNTIVDSPDEPISPCVDCDADWTNPFPPGFTAPPPWGLGEPPPNEQAGPNPNPAVDETVLSGVVETADGSWTTSSLSTTLTNQSPIGGGWEWQAMDPMAQTFFIEGMPFGTYLTKVDLFFKTKADTLPVTIQIREVVNGLPGDVIVPFSSVTLYPASINVSTDSSIPTEFKFDSPVYLKNNTEYCLVVLPAGNTADYQVWVSELGETTVGVVPIQKISQQPFSGVLFVSANNTTWTALQAEDLKFTLYRADFSTDTLASIYLKNAPIDYAIIVPNSSVNILQAGDVITSSSGEGIIQYINLSTNEAKVYVTSGELTASSITVQRNNTTFAATLGTVNNKKYNAVAPNIGYVDHTPTAAVWGYRTVTTAGVGSGFFSPLILGDTTSTSEEMSVYSYTNEIDDLSLVTSEGSLMFRADFYTKTSTVSPVIDLRKSSVILISNDINNTSTNETGNSGSASARYISRQVVLTDGQDAEDLKVYLTENLPAGSTVQVYVKLLHASDSESFSLKSWVLMDLLSSPTGTISDNSYGEYEYSLPTSVLNGSDIYEYTVGSTTYAGFKTFAVKIVMLSSNSSRVPKLKDLRVIALQV